jgi:hypothetical protein
LGASVTFWEATAPVKLPAGHCPRCRQGLGARAGQSGISPSPPRPPRGAHRRVPPILRSRALDPMPSCSEAPRGLFVQSRVARIFTRTSISPGPSSRQRPDRYTIRAGRNLPDKEFRYLRTVIVTAAVHRGFGWGLLKARPLTFRHWAGVSPYASAVRLQQGPVFLVNSRLGPLSAPRAGSAPLVGSTPPGPPSSEGTGAICRVP